MKMSKTSKKTDESIINLAAAKWCMDKGYKIYPIPVQLKRTKFGNNSIGVKFKLVVEYGGQRKVGTKEYSQEEWGFAIWSIYNFLYKRNNGEKA